MTKEEFLRKVADEYGGWCSRHDRRESSWWLSLKEYAATEFNRAYEREEAEQ